MGGRGHGVICRCPYQPSARRVYQPAALPLRGLRVSSRRYRTSHTSADTNRPRSCQVIAVLSLGAASARLPLNIWTKPRLGASAILPSIEGDADPTRARAYSGGRMKSRVLSFVAGIVFGLALSTFTSGTGTAVAQSQCSRWEVKSTIISSPLEDGWEPFAAVGQVIVLRRCYR